jgi:hypothetical protein
MMGVEEKRRETFRRRILVRQKFTTGTEYYHDKSLVYKTSTFMMYTLVCGHVVKRRFFKDANRNPASVICEWCESAEEPQEE